MSVCILLYTYTGSFDYVISVSILSAFQRFQVCMVSNSLGSVHMNIKSYPGNLSEAYRGHFMDNSRSAGNLEWLSRS